MKTLGYWVIRDNKSKFVRWVVSGHDRDIVYSLQLYLPFVIDRCLQSSQH